MYPIRDFKAIIPPDQIAIVSVGCIEESRPFGTLINDALYSAILTLSVDHRLINGREGAEFLVALKDCIEDVLI